MSLSAREQIIHDTMVADPATYGPLIATSPGGKTDPQVADIFNGPAPGGVTVDVDTIDPSEFMSLVARAEWPSPTLNPGNDAYLQTLVMAGPIRVTAQTKAGVLAIFGAGTATRAALEARLTRPKTRGEVAGLAKGEPATADEVNRARNL